MTTATKTDPIITLPTQPIRFEQLTDLTAAWISAHAVQIMIAAGAGILVYLAIAALREFGKRRALAAATRTEGMGFSTVLARAIAKTTHFFMVMVAARLVAGYANPPELVLRTVQFLFTVAAVFQGAIWAREIILGYIEKRTGEEGTSETLLNAMGIIRLLVSVALFAIATVVVLDNLGVNVTGLVAGLGIGGIAIGLAAQGIFSDLFAALSIIFDKPFRRGEVITYDTTTARVEKIGLKSTRLRAVTGERKVISNANLLQKEITGLQHLVMRRIKFAIGVIYQTPPETCARIPEMLKEAVETVKGVSYLHAGIVGFGASSIDFELEFDLSDPDSNDYFNSRHHAALAVLKRLNDEGVEFAYPTQMSFTAAPDGKAIMPYPQRPAAKA
ncbi:MAG: mechanosensitive ion channel protein MscS [Sphingobium sp.]|nr:MAG: mechanosensitive ion channel protein MscS [Sphingobium sp.]